MRAFQSANQSRAYGLRLQKLWLSYASVADWDKKTTIGV
jgi:hypothetical protein